MRKSLLFLIAAWAVFLYHPLWARDILLGIGGRVGATIDPDQVHVGLHLDLGELYERVRLQPNIELGVGSGRTVVAINPEVLYLFNPKGSWTPYAGGGLGLNIVNYDEAKFMISDMEFEVGLNLLGGFETRVSRVARLFFECKLGVADSPDLKTSTGLTFTL
ncbi:MAG TPA: hypothetical protein VM123_20025 [archaeon]|nr:hypothetical protein [archaeon]